MPDTIQFTAGHENYYTYDASGKKLELTNYTLNSPVIVPQGAISPLPGNSSDYTKTVTDYCGNVIYQNGSLKEVLTPEGYWQNSVFYYYLKDHQGNTREVINSSGTVMKYSDYYPDGMRFESSTSNSAALPYRYNGKELEAMNGLNQYDYGARRRETGIPVWTTMDPLAEKYYGVSPYAYCSDNPINRIDPDGKKDYTLSLDLRLGTGEIGFKGKVLGIPIGFDLSLGSASQSYKFYVSYDSDKKSVKGGVSYIQTETEAGSGSFALGVEGGESKERSKTYDINTKDGASKNIEATFHTKESGGVDKIKTENGNLNLDISSLDVRALLLSIGAKINLQVTPTQSTNNIENKTKDKK